MRGIKKDLSYLEKELKENRDVFLYEDIEEVCVRIKPNRICFIKFKNENPYPVKMDSTIVTNALSECVFISKEQYEQY